MKTLSTIGAILIIGGILLAIYGYSLYANVECMCPMQQVGQPSNCHCSDEREQISHFIIHVGIAVTLGGVGFLVYSLRKSIPVGSSSN
jgi:uncharacterized membrane protein YidH (DUF202 family)